MDVGRVTEDLGGIAAKLSEFRSDPVGFAEWAFIWGEGEHRVACQTSVTGRGTGWNIRFDPMVLAISSPRSGVRG